MADINYDAMINVDRDAIAFPNVLYGEDSIGQKETIAAIDSYKAHEKFNAFEAYKHPEVKWSLYQLFHGKCAYCESKYVDTQPMDVEHFRPKGAITTNGIKLDHYGYYWLAANWDNLLPSCIDCNRQREQLSGLTGNYGITGKANEFPLADESKRAINPGEEINETYLLLNPCNLSIKPEDHLDFKEDGIVLPRLNSSLGTNSIRVFGLNRIPLVQARKEKITKINHAKFTIRCLTSDVFEEEGKLRKNVIFDIIFEQVNNLAKMCSPKEVFTALARQHIHPFIENLILQTRN